MKTTFVPPVEINPYQKLVSFLLDEVGLHLTFTLTDQRTYTVHVPQKAMNIEYTPEEALVSDLALDVAHVLSQAHVVSDGESIDAKDLKPKEDP